MTLPKEIPCACCSSAVRVIVRGAAGGKVKYVGAKCANCGLFIDVAGHDSESAEAAEANALRELRGAWGRAKAEIQKIITENGCEQLRACEIYIARNKIVIAQQRKTRRKSYGKQ